jgi:hypothetical protein
MYLTAQRVRSQVLHEEVHAFLHLHDRPDCAFPADPLAVPGYQPGRLVFRSQVTIRPGGNNVISYLDIIVPDGLWSPHWAERVAGLGDFVAQQGVPWLARIGPVHVVFDAMRRPRAEYESLVEAALSLWNLWPGLQAG